MIDERNRHLGEGVIPVRVCSRCVMDSVATEIEFDDDGKCTYCRMYESQFRGSLNETQSVGFEKVAAGISGMSGRGRYDCIIGVSGGVDSTYVAWLAKKHGLRPLAVHFDNGWNSELAVKNIEETIRRLGIDLHTHVVDWEEFKDIQLSYFKAGVVDIEAVTDHGIFASLYHAARMHDIRTILSGVNTATEGILPYTWHHPKLDHVNLQSIHHTHGRRKIKTFPVMDNSFKKWARRAHLRSVNVLDYIDYQRDEAEATIEKELGWQPYGGKHYESIFTRFYQGYILPIKFGIDKRKAHLSNLICSGQITRDVALRELKDDPVAADVLEQDRAYVLKKLGFSEVEFDRLMREKPRLHRDYEFEGSVFHRYPALMPLRPLWRALKPLLRG
jgi:N-acetyl sugar amidotransferase